MKKEKINISYSASLDAVTDFMLRHNNSVTRQADRITGGMKSLADRMIVLYLKQINGQLVDPASDRVPGFRTFNPSLAKDRGCTVRTIINLRRRMVRTGFIQKEVLLGNEGIYIWFADVLFAHNDLYRSLASNVKNFHPPSLFFDQSVKSLHPLVFPSLLNNNNNRDVDKWIRPGTELQDEKKVMNTKEKGLGAEEGQPDSVPPTLSNSAMVENFWLRARKAFYPREIFDRERTQKILNLIYVSVYEKFQGHRSAHLWQKWHEIALCRIDMVHRWLQRNPNRWVPLPERYFDPQNQKNGFSKTIQWYFKK